MEEPELLAKIKQKPELRGIDDSVVSGSLNNYMKKHSLVLPKLKKSQIKIIIKEIRAELRTLVGQFQKSKKRIEALSDFQELLKTHLSTAERLSFYPNIKNLFNKLRIKSVLDLGCGLNPIALASPDFQYYASDINLSDLKKVQDFFNKNNIKGKTFVCDLRNISSCPLPLADITLLFKVLDIIEPKGHKLAEKIILHSNSKYILASFATRKLSGKPMNFPRRLWFEKMLSRLSLKFESFSSNNEIFYLIYNKK